MRIIGVILIIFGIISGLLGVRSYLRDDAYAKESVVVKASVKSAEVKPMAGKGVASIQMVLTFMRDGVVDSIENNFSKAYSTNKPLPTVEELKAASPYVRYVPKKKRTESIPNWVLLSSNGEFDGSYGRSLFGKMFILILLGIILWIFERKQQTIRKLVC